MAIEPRAVLKLGAYITLFATPLYHDRSGSMALIKSAMRVTWLRIEALPARSFFICSPLLLGSSGIADEGARHPICSGEAGC